MGLSEEKKAAMETAWKIIEKVIGIAVVAGFVWIWNAEGRISGLEGAAKGIAGDVLTIKTDVKEFSEKFTAFLIEQAEERGHQKAEREARERNP